MKAAQYKTEYFKLKAKVLSDVSVYVSHLTTKKSFPMFFSIGANKTHINSDGVLSVEGKRYDYDELNVLELSIVLENLEKK